MDPLPAKFTQLRDQLETIAFLFSKGGSEKQTHSDLVRALITLAEIEKMYSINRFNSGISDKFANEVKKVRNRLKLWARPDRQSQINVRILNAFLKIKNSGAPIVREEDLRQELSDIESFDSNFAQMKIIAEKNHGKVFEQDGSAVTIWEQVLPYVREYELATELAISPLRQQAPRIAN